MRKKFFALPTWCDVCGGILIARGFQCTGPCKSKCHCGLGNETEHCRIELLLTQCEVGTPRPQRGYKFGDASKQLSRDCHQKVKDLVVKEAVKEQARFGKFDKLKQLVQKIRACWNGRNGGAMSRRLMLWQLGSVVAMFVATYAVTWACVWPTHGLQGWRLAAWQAVGSAAILIILQGLLLMGIGLVAARTLLYSDLVHEFAQEILGIHLEDLDIDLKAAAAAVVEVAQRLVAFSSALWIVAVALWLQELRLA